MLEGLLRGTLWIDTSFIHWMIQFESAESTDDILFKQDECIIYTV